jgi:hypothetical protein
VSGSEIEEGKAGDQVGGVRSFTLTDGTHLRERLLAHSDAELSLTYNFEQTPFDVENYRATMRVTPVTDGDRSFVEWWTTFDCDRVEREQWEAFFANEVFANGFAALRGHLGA